MVVSYFMLVVSSLLLGAVTTLILQFYFLRRYFYHQECVAVKDKVTPQPFQLPKAILESIKMESLPIKESCLALNLLLQFLFHELRDAEKIRCWFRKKLELEFEELITRTTVGKMFGSIQIREIHLGSQFPNIKNISVEKVKVNKDYSHIDTLDLKLDLHYTGGFQLVINANLLLGKAACLSIKVTELIGEGRLQFTRLPYSHWSFTFYNEPKLKLEVESQFQGRPLPQITALITSQIRKSIKKKHTLPHFKLRYKPFFNKPEERPALDAIPASHFHITLHQLSRLNDSLLTSDKEIYCIATLDTIPFVEIVQYGSNFYYVIDLVIVKKTSQPLGLIFKQDYVEDKKAQCVVLDAVTQNSPASDGDACKGDIIISVDGKRVSNLNQAPKLIKSTAIQFTLRIERKVSNKLITEVSKSSLDDTVKPFSLSSTLRRRRGSDSDSSSSSPPNSTPGSPSKRPPPKSNLDLKQPLLSQTSTPTKSRTVSEDHLPDGTDGSVRLYKTRNYINSQIIAIEEQFTFVVRDEDRYLNINIRSAPSAILDRDNLLGYINIPIRDILTSVDALKCFELKPADPFAAMNSRSHKLSSQNGFNPMLCYGDILLTIAQTPKLGISAPIRLDPIYSITSQSSSENSSRPGSGEKKHDFVRTHFQSSTQCEFCGKKIWLKDAMQCRECSMACHKKCIAKCQVSAACGASRSSTNLAAMIYSTSTISNLVDADIDYKADDGGDGSRRPSVQPEIITTSVDDDTVIPQQPSTARKGIGSLLASVASAGRGLKRVGSANNLSLPGGGQASQQCKSLPPSPQQSPAPSRKASLPDDISEEISVHLQLLMQQGSDQADMMDYAKATGKTLYEDLNLPERKEKIHEMINKLNSAINCESEVRSSLVKEEGSSRDASSKTKLAFKIGKSDEKTQALAVLMLHFFAGLQHIQDLEEQEKEAMTETIEVEATVNNL